MMGKRARTTAFFAQGVAPTGERGPVPAERFVRALDPVLQELAVRATRLSRQLTDADDGALLTDARQMLEAVDLLQTLRGEFLSLLQLQASAPAELPCLPLHPIAEPCLELMRPQAHAAEVPLTLAVPPSLRVQAEPTFLARILRGLLGNAIRHNPSGTAVTLSARRHGAHHVLLRVADSGVGIAPEDQQRLFQPFERLGKELCASDGTGMGLALSRQMARLMGGDMWLRSRPRRGTVVTVRLRSGQKSD